MKDLSAPPQMLPGSPFPRLATLAMICALVAFSGQALLGVPAPPQDVHVVWNLYVATNGLDTNPGTIDQPLATLEAARDAVRALRQLGGLNTSSCTVWIRNGTYYRSTAFALGAQDSGTPLLPVVYRAFSNDVVTFTGAKAITSFIPVTNATVLSRLTASAQTNVLVADISGLGVSDYGSLTNRGAITGTGYSGYMRPWMVELFFDDQRQQLARWPNQDPSQEVWAYTTIPVAGYHQTWFTYRESNPARWALTETVWVHGMWAYWWSDSYLQVLSVNTSSNAITTDRTDEFGFAANQPYEALNVLEELDQPGEWVIDRANNRVYFWPPSTNANQRTSLSVMNSDFVTLTNGANIQFQSLIFDAGRGSGISMRYSTNILVAGCTFQNLGNMGVVVGNSIYTNSVDLLPVAYDYQGGISNQVVGCYLHDLGEGGILLSGGDRSALMPSGHSAINNYIHDYNTNIRGYRPAVKLDGVGARVSHAVIHDSPHDAIWFSGNDHVIEYCNIYRVCKDTADAGAIYAAARDWKQQGTIIRYNLIQPCRENGIYLDDFTSGVTMYGNILMEVSIPILIGGGRGNTVANNLVIGFSSAAWEVDNRGTTWASGSIPGLVTSLQTVNYTSAPYSKYPEMASLATDISNYSATNSATNLNELAMSKDNAVNTNVFIAATGYLSSIASNRVAQVGNFYYGPSHLDDFSGFTVNPTICAVGARNFTLATNLGGFQQIPQSSMGVYTDPYGAVNPALIQPYPPVATRAPFKTLNIPGTIQIEDYDDGPQGNVCSSVPAGASTYDSTTTFYGNNAWGSGRYRLESPFYIWGSYANGARTYAVDINSALNWAEYTVNVAATKTYTLTVTATTYWDGGIHFLLDGATLTSSMTTNSPSATVSLTAGTHVLRLVNEVTDNNRLDYMTFK
jgi:hypothetical protein